MNRACLNRKQDLFRHLADKCRSQPQDVRRRFSRARDSFNRAQKDHSCKTQLSSGKGSGKGSSGKGSSGKGSSGKGSSGKGSSSSGKGSSGKGSSGGSTACTCGGQTR